MKTLLFQLFVSLFIVSQSYASIEADLLAELNESSFKMEVYQRQGKMVVVHLANKTDNGKLSLKIKDNKGHLLHSEKIAGKRMYVKKFDLSSIKANEFKVAVYYEDKEYKADVSIKEIEPLLAIHQRPQKIVAVQTENTYNKMVTISITNAISGEELNRKQVFSPGKSVNKFDFSKTAVDYINIKVVAAGKIINKTIDLSLD